MNVLGNVMSESELESTGVGGGDPGSGWWWPDALRANLKGTER